MTEQAQLTRAGAISSTLVAAGSPAVINVAAPAGGPFAGAPRNCVVIGALISNLAAAAIFIRSYDLNSIVAVFPTFIPGTVPTASQLLNCVPKTRASLPANTTASILIPTENSGIPYYGGCFFTVTGGSPDNDATAVPANGCMVDIRFF